MIAATSGDPATLFLELGAVAVVLAVLARVAGRFGFTAIPLYLLAGLALGDGGVAPLDVSHDFIHVVGEIGALLLLLSLGLEYSASELRHGLRAGAITGVFDAVANFTPGFVAGLLLGWSTATAVLLGGVAWVTSSGISAKVLTDLDRLANRETPAILDLLVFEDLAMAAFLPVGAALVLGRSASATALTILIAVGTVVAILAAALRFGDRLSRALATAGDEALLLAVFGLTLMVAGLAQRLEASAAIGAFVVGLALSGSVQRRAAVLMTPLRDLSAALFFVFFSFQVDPGKVADALVPAALLAAVAMATKLATGWVAGRRAGVGRAGRLRAGATLTARGEFSIVIAGIGTTSSDGVELTAVAAAFVLITAIAGPIAARLAR